MTSLCDSPVVLLICKHCWYILHHSGSGTFAEVHVVLAHPANTPVFCYVANQKVTIRCVAYEVYTYVAEEAC